MTGTGPQRSCLGCRTAKDKRELLRFVLAPDRQVVPDLLGKLPGRGAYTCLDKNCLRQAVDGKQFARTFKGAVTVQPAEALIAQIAFLLEERIASYLALANKAGRIVSGSDMVMQVLKKNQNERLVLFATDISEDIKQKVLILAEKSGAKSCTLFDKERVGALIGKSLRSVVVVEGHGFVTAIDFEIQRYRNFMGEVRNR